MVSAFLPRSLAVANEKLARFSKSYAAHRPVIQRILNTSFIIYVLCATYTSIVGGAGRMGRDRSKKSKKDSRKGKPERVAVCRRHSQLFMFL